MALPIAVVDKYFMADAHANLFQHLTAKAICGQCAVRAACLVDAIQAPVPSAGVRGGESAHAIQQLRRRYTAGEASAEVLGAAALLRQRPLGGVGLSATLRAGHFADAELLDGS